MSVRIMMSGKRGLTMAELKPCPFCGSENVIAEINNLDKEFVIFCENDCCRAEMKLPFADTMVGNGEFISFYEMQKIMDDLTNAWNRRADT